MAKKLYIDFETRSAVDLKTSGVHRYAEDPTTSIMVLAAAFDDEPPFLATKKVRLAEVLDHVGAGKPVVAHNASFELTLWNYVGVKRHGWPTLSAEQTSCTMVRAYAMGLPGGLEKAAAAVGLHMQKDMKGHRLMMKLSQPRKILSTGEIIWWSDAADFKRLGEYALQDVEVERALDKRLLALSPKERRVWELDQRINNRGIQVDIPAAMEAIKIAEAEMGRLNVAIRRASGNQVATYNANAQLKRFVNLCGVKTDSTDKAAVVRMLADETLPPMVRQVLEIRQEAAKSSVAKLKAMVSGASFDGRMRGTFQYHGANTGRWAGRRVNFQNLPRPSIKPSDVDTIIDGIGRGLKVPGDKVMSTLANCLRGFIIAAPGKKLFAMDFSAIEARVLAWEAGEQSVVEIFRTHGKIYEKAASDVFGVSRDDVSSTQRQVGKVCVLALGYGGGVGAFQAMAKNYGVKMAPVGPYLWSKADTRTKEWALKRWATEAKEALENGISKQEWLASELTKVAWRQAHPNIVTYWQNVEEAAKLAMRVPGNTYMAGAEGRWVSFLHKGSFLFCRLPSGRCLSYPYPQLKEMETRFGKREMLSYMSEVNFQWVRCKTYGGSLVENITQAVARDLLAEAMLRVEKAGYPIVLHVHDELVVEVEDADIEEFKKIVSEVPPWAKGLPIAADGWSAKRYRK